MPETGSSIRKLAEFNFAFLNEGTKREIRRKTLKAIAIPGHQVAFASRDLPIARGWGTGGLQLTLSLITLHDCLKVIDQGSDSSINAVSIRQLIQDTSGIRTTEDTTEATFIQSRHRIPEEPLQEGQILVLQVPFPEPLRKVEAREEVTRRLHADKQYSDMWLSLYEHVVKWGNVAVSNDYPVMVEDRYLMSPSPIPRWDTLKLHRAKHLTLFGAGREKKIYAIPPYTRIVPISFDDYPFEAESMNAQCCRLCGSRTSYLEETIDDRTGKRQYQCSDTAFCRKQRHATKKEKSEDHDEGS